MIIILLISLGVAMDAFAVAISSGTIIRTPKLRDAIKIAGAFGFFQIIMPAIGWLIGSGLSYFIARIDHWLAFIILLIIGSKMLWKAMKKKDEKIIDPLNPYVLLILAIATSIDALVVGISLPIIKVPLITTLIVMGLITFIFSFIGVFIGEKLGHIVGEKCEIIGGLILIGIGTKILIEHLC